MKLAQLVTLFGGAALAFQSLVAPRKYYSVTHCLASSHLVGLSLPP